MDRKLLDFFNGSANVVSADFAITREHLPNGIQFVSISYDGDVLYEFWYNPKKNKQKNKKPKHIGGKKPYVMVMTEVVEELKKKNIKNVPGLIGCLVYLSGNIEWNTGRLIHKRSKKSLKYKDLAAIFSYSNKKLNRIIGELRELDLLFSTKEGYFISSKLIKKGGR